MPSAWYTLLTNSTSDSCKECAIRVGAVGEVDLEPVFIIQIHYTSGKPLWYRGVPDFSIGGIPIFISGRTYDFLLLAFEKAEFDFIPFVMPIVYTLYVGIES